MVMAGGVERPCHFVRHACTRENAISFRQAIETDQHHAVGTALHQRLRRGELGLEIVVMAGEQQRVAGGGKLLRKRVRGAGEDRIVDRRKHGADRPRAPCGERTRRAMRYVAQHGGGLEHALPRVIAHHGRLGDCARGGGERDTRGACHVGEAGGRVAIHAERLYTRDESACGAMRRCMLDVFSKRDYCLLQPLT